MNDNQIKEITVEEAIKMIKSGDGQMVDVRTAQEYHLEHVPDAKWIPLDQLPQRLSELDKDKAIFACLCKSGNRSSKACEILKSNGFSKLYNVRGGILAWKEAGFKTVSSY